jgi:hypothetical protein
MDAKQPFDPLDELALDRRIQEALDVNPSPEFVARVRMRIADERPARSLLRAGMLGGLAVALTVVIAALVIVRHEAPTITPPKVITGRPPTPAGEITQRQPADAPAVLGSSRPGTSSRVTSSTQTRVIVPAGQIEAFRQLAEAINAGLAFADTIELPERDPSAEDEDTAQIFANVRRPIEPLAVVTIEPLEIDPISQ